MFIVFVNDSDWDPRDPIAMLSDRREAESYADSVATAWENGVSILDTAKATLDQGNHTVKLDREQVRRLREAAARVLKRGHRLWMWRDSNDHFGQEIARTLDEAVAKYYRRRPKPEWIDYEGNRYALKA